MTKRDKTLLDLPVLPRDRDDACGTDVVRDTYVKDRKSISSVEDVVRFVDKWKNIWLLAYKDESKNELSLAERSLIEGTFDAPRIAEWLPKMKDMTNEEVEAAESDLSFSAAMHMCLPITLCDADLLASHYGVGADLGLVRLFLDHHENLINKLR